MSEPPKDTRKRQTPASSSGESTSTPKPDTKKAKPFDPQAEAAPLGQRRSQAQIPSTASSSSTLEPGTPGPQPAEAADNEVFNPHDKTVADISLDDSGSDDLFELAMTAENYVQAEALVTTDTQRKRVWLAKKSKVRTLNE